MKYFFDFKVALVKPCFSSEVAMATLFSRKVSRLYAPNLQCKSHAELDVKMIMSDWVLMVISKAVDHCKSISDQ